MTKKIFLSVTLIAAGIFAFAQNRTQQRCATEIIHEQLIGSDPAYRAGFLANEQRMAEIIAEQKTHKGQHPGTQTIYTIPIVVHVIHLGEAVGAGTNISDAQINSAITNMNNCFRNNPPYNGVDIGLEFALAKRDPNCSPTTGILRVNGSSVNGYSTSGISPLGGSNEAAVKALSRWPNGSYYNIWVVAGIDGNFGGPGIEGYAYFPGISIGSPVDGMVVLCKAFGYDPTGALGYYLDANTKWNGTANHELGHGIGGLYHTFEGDAGGSQCPSGNQCGSGLGDCCGDTPPHIQSMSTCDPGGMNSCDGGSSNSLFCHNFMDYSSEDCKTQFTADQSARIQAALAAGRSSLTTSLGATAISGSKPSSTLSCQPNTTDLATTTGMGISKFTLGSLSAVSGNAIADGGYTQKWCVSATLSVSATYSLTVTNSSGNATNNENVKVFIDYNNNGNFSDAGENIFSSTAPSKFHSGTFTVPANPVKGVSLWVRVISDFQNYSISGPCYAPMYGQAEDYSVVINGTATSVEEMDALNYSLSVFPNPVLADQLNMALNGMIASGEVRLEITGVTGIKIFSGRVAYSPGDVISIPVGSDIPGGIYFVTATANDKDVHQKFVVER